MRLRRSAPRWPGLASPATAAEPGAGAAAVERAGPAGGARPPGRARTPAERRQARPGPRACGRLQRRLAPEADVGNTRFTGITDSVPVAIVELGAADRDPRDFRTTAGHQRTRD